MVLIKNRGAKRSPVLINKRNLREVLLFMGCIYRFFKQLIVHRFSADFINKKSIDHAKSMRNSSYTFRIDYLR